MNATAQAAGTSTRCRIGWSAWTNIWTLGVGAAGIGDNKKGQLFRSSKKGDKLTRQTDDMQ